MNSFVEPSIGEEAGVGVLAVATGIKSKAEKFTRHFVFLNPKGNDCLRLTQINKEHLTTEKTKETMATPIVTLLPPETCTNYALLPNEKLLSISIPTSANPQGRGLVGILTVPPAALLDETTMLSATASADHPHPPTHRLAIVLHGKGGHKNYCYQALVAEALATKLGMYSFRFDFRGCGDSQENEQPEKGRKVLEDIEDIELVYDVFKRGGDYAEIGTNLVPNSIIGHSRGSVSMFQWALKQQTRLEMGQSFQFVPNLINCSARYMAKRLLRDLEGKGAFASVLNQYRLGEYRDIKIPAEEVIDLASQDLSKVKLLDDEIQVLSIYGMDDHIVPLSDSTYFANLLGSRHQLTFIPHADHNFYGIQTINDDNADEFNPEGYPLNKKRKVNWNYKVTETIVDWLHTSNDVQRYKRATQEVYYYPRWRDIEGISNFRDIGGWRTEDNKHYVKAGIIFRCANPSNVTEFGKTQLKTLGVTQFFDFRSLPEFTKAGGLSITGIDVNNVPVFSDVDVSPQAIAQRYKNLLASWYTYKYVYEDMLNHGVNAYKSVLLFLRDNPSTGVVYNCTAGKDRTGVMTMLILLLLGVDHHTIAKEYELTTIGLVPDHARIKEDFYSQMTKLQKRLEYDPDVAAAHKQLNANASMEEMFENLISSRYESMISTIELFNHKFGGIEQYCKSKLGLTQEDIDTIRRNLLTKSSPYPDQNSTWKHRQSMGSLL